MNWRTERLLLQLAVGIATLVPILAGGAGILLGAEFIRGVPIPVPPDLDSHFRYLSGLLLAIGVGFVTCIPRIEEKGARFRLLGAVVLVGGLGRALSLFEVGVPGLGHRLALGMELGVTPLLLLWQWRIEAGWRRTRPVGAQKSQGAAGPSSDDPLNMASDRK
jgi:hypothetical protein